MRLRRRLITLHRDVGYLCVGLVLAYAISGVAVNHRHHWNYNQSTELRVTRLPDAAALLGTANPSGTACASAETCARLAREHRPRVVDAVCRALGRGDRPHKAFWRGPHRLSLFFGEDETDVVDYDVATGRTEHLARINRPVIRQVNFLHLNESPAVWTWVADAFALALAFLAVSGAVMVKGKYGLRGRGGVLLALGLALPVLAVLMLS